MITDERDLATSLRTVDTPPSLTLDPDQVLGRAHRTDRRHRAGRGALATGSVAAVAATALWATGTAVGPIAVLPAAPWTDGCQGIVEGATGASINLDQVSYAELPVSGASSRTAVVAFDACEGEGGRLAYAALGADGRVGEVAAWTEPDAETLQLLRNAQTLTPGTAPTQDGQVLFGLVATNATEVRVLGSSGAIDVQRETLPDTGLDAYVSDAYTDVETETLGMTWQDELGGVTVIWHQVLDVADFDATGGVTEPLVAQSRDGIWRIWFGDEQANMEGELGQWLSVEFLKGEGREVVTYLPEGAEVEVTAQGGGEAASAEIRYAEPEVAEGRFAWISAPNGSKITWVGSDGTQEVLESPPTSGTSSQ